MGWCTHVLHAYCGPLITIAVGVGFMLVGAVPVAITYAIDAHGSATIIGVGFVGFGLLVVLPGVAWCLLRRISALRCCRSKQHRLHRSDDEFAADDRGSTVVPPVSIQRHLATLSGRESSTTRCYILTDEQYLCSDKSGIFFEPPDSNERAVAATGSPDDVELDVHGSGSSLRANGYMPLSR